MKPIVKQSDKKPSFTIVELLTVMTIVVILFSLLVPSLAMVRRYAKRVKQNAQFHSIAVGLDLFNDDFEGYPDSGQYGAEGAPQAYCGAMKLAEAMVGRDLLGFHPSSLFRKDGENPNLSPPYNVLYPEPFQPETNPVHRENLKTRKETYVPLEGIDVCRIGDLYLPFVPFDPRAVVLCDEYRRMRRRDTGDRVGMPILYYKANVSNTLHVYSATGNSQNIYNYDDNKDLVDFALPWSSSFHHPMSSNTSWQTPTGDPPDPNTFYGETRDEKIKAIPRPKNVDSYILMSAGFDGLYGTDDDVFNFAD